MLLRRPSGAFQEGVVYNAKGMCSISPDLDVFTGGTCVRGRGRQGAIPVWQGLAQFSFRLWMWVHLVCPSRTRCGLMRSPIKMH